MKHEFGRKAPLIRLVLGIAALVVTSLIGGFIDFLATDHVATVAELLHGRVQLAERP